MAIARRTVNLRLAVAALHRQPARLDRLGPSHGARCPRLHVTTVVDDADVNSAERDLRGQRRPLPLKACRFCNCRSGAHALGKRRWLLMCVRHLVPTG